MCYICIFHVMMCEKTVLCVTCVSSCHRLYYSNEQCLVSLGLDLTITLIFRKNSYWNLMNWKSRFLMKTATFILFFDWR